LPKVKVKFISRSPICRPIHRSDLRGYTVKVWASYVRVLCIHGRYYDFFNIFAYFSTRVTVTYRSRSYILCQVQGGINRNIVFKFEQDVSKNKCFMANCSFHLIESSYISMGGGVILMAVSSPIYGLHISIRYFLTWQYSSIKCM